MANRVVPHHQHSENRQTPRVMEVEPAVEFDCSCLIQPVELAILVSVVVGSTQKPALAAAA